MIIPQLVELGTMKPKKTQIVNYNLAARMQNLLQA